MTITVICSAMCLTSWCEYRAKDRIFTYSVQSQRQQTDIAICILDKRVSRLMAQVLLVEDPTISIE
ncbi:hypothetical protein BCE02nite_40230 [Brevibacillus centrosporus]|nr:hypothetical protein BCE02nite_40230 [Brevibacillus centrosporus]